MNDGRGVRKPSLFERVVEKSGVVYISRDGTKLKNMREVRRYCSILGYHVKDTEFDFTKPGGATKGKKVVPPQAPSTAASKLKVKFLPSVKSTSKDIADDVKAIREALNMKPELPTKRKKAAELTKKRGRKPKLTDDAMVNGQGKTSIEIPNAKLASGSSDSELESQSAIVQDYKPANSYYEQQLESASSSETSSFLSPAGRPMRQRKPNQRYTDLLSETEGGRRRQPSNRYSTGSSTAEDDDVLISYVTVEEASFHPPPEKKAKMKKTAKIHTVLPMMMPVSSPLKTVKTLMPKKMKQDVGAVKRKYTKRQKLPQEPEVAELPALVKGEFEQPPEFVEIQERPPTPIDELEENLMKDDAVDDTLPPILPISALSIQRPISPLHRRSPPKPATFDSIVTPPPQPPSSSSISASIANILSIPSSLLTSSGELDFSQFTMPGDELPPPSTSNESTTKAKKRTPKKPPIVTNDSILINQKLLSLGSFAPPPTTMITQSEFARNLILDKVPPKRRLQPKKPTSRASAEAERSMRLETEEALQGIKVSGVQMTPDGTTTLIDLPKVNKTRRGGRYGANSSFARVAAESMDDPNYRPMRPSFLSQRTNRSQPHLGPSYLDEMNKFCTLPPEVAGDHCYGKSQPMPPAGLEPSTSYGYVNSSEQASSSSSIKKSHVLPPNLTKVVQPRKEGGGRLSMHQIARRVSPSPPPYTAEPVHGLSPSYSNDPNLGAYYGTMDVDGSAMLNANQGQTMLASKLPANVLDDDSDAGEQVTRIDIQ